ncbi:hypothetical protein Ahy_A06g028727 [Arachis hypogaea]|uniref:DUF7876 domain-containing protein n=1 Tax=Arachis hypogaea TaxID=3818 RepID=A0A445CRP7_ARAHY|nr:hypothetical protein Ahy_A06g028727 [Arachis hypogaea]
MYLDINVSRYIDFPMYQKSKSANWNEGGVPNAIENGPYDYTRSGNPTRDASESLLAKLDKADRALCFTSGMAALSAISHLAQAGAFSFFHSSQSSHGCRCSSCRLHDSISSKDEYRSSRNIEISLFRRYRNFIDHGGGDNLKEFITAGVNAYALGCTDEGLRKELTDIKDSDIEIEAMSSYGGSSSLKSKIISEEIEPQLLSRKNVMIAAHGNSLRSIILYLDKLTSQEVIVKFLLAEELKLPNLSNYGMKLFAVFVRKMSLVIGKASKKMSLLALTCLLLLSP